MYIPSVKWPLVSVTEDDGVLGASINIFKSPKLTLKYIKDDQRALYQEIYETKKWKIGKHQIPT